MLEDFVPAAAQRLRASILGAFLDEFCSFLIGSGYAASTVRLKLRQLFILARWMEAEDLSVIDLDERAVDRFIEARRRSHHGDRSTALQLIGQLRIAGVVPMPEPLLDESPAGALLQRYEGYLRRERGLARSTILAYQSLAAELVASQLSEGATQLDSLCSDDIGEFLLSRAQHLSPKRVQLVASGLRSFLHFLFLHDEIQVDLALAVPAVRQWRHCTVPRYLPEEDVERLIFSCDHSSATGRRNRAILLLLARLGLRASEIVGLELDDVDWRAGEIVVRGKGPARDRLPLLSEVGEALALYLQTDRPVVACRRIFLCARAPHRGFSHPSSVSTIVRRALDHAGLAPPSRGAHVLRHSLATKMLRRGASLTEIGQVLRHRSANTTEIYAKLDFEALRDVAMPWPNVRGVR